MRTKESAELPGYLTGIDLTTRTFVYEVAQSSTHLNSLIFLNSNTVLKYIEKTQMNDASNLFSLNESNLAHLKSKLRSSRARM